MAERSRELIAEMAFLDTSSRGNPRGEFVYKALLQAIRSGRFLPGHRLREEELSQLLGVSRTPVREALQQLQARRLIDIAPGRGFVVAELSVQQVLELFAMREVLEGEVAHLAAQHAASAEIAIMRELLDAFTAAKGDVPKLEALNKALHRTIYDSARNRYMIEALDNLDVAFSLLHSTTFSLPQRQTVADREHRDIVAAIANRDGPGAAAASRFHIRETQQARLALFNVSEAPN